MDTTGHIDSGLWQSFKAGSRISYKEIYEKYFDNLFEYGARLTKNEELVEDTIQELFIKLWQNKSGLGDVTSVKSYLLVALRGAIYNKLKKEKKKYNLNN